MVRDSSVQLPPARAGAESPTPPGPPAGAAHGPGASDVELIRLCRANNRTAFNTLVERYQDRLYNASLRLVGNAADAADLCQEAFLKAFENLDKFEARSSFGTWTYRIAMNLCLSHLRRRRLVPVARPMGVSGGEDGEPAGLDPADPAADPTADVERRDRDKKVQEAIAGLEEDQRVVVLLRDIDGYSYEDIAEILDCPVGTVRSRLHRARAELAVKLRGLAGTV